MKEVIVKYAPITERYWSEGDTAQIDTKNKQIRIGGCWFPFDERYKIEEV